MRSSFLAALAVMTDETSGHAAFVRGWMNDAARELPPAQQVELFDRALGALWRRAHRTLGDVTLGAIVDRVLHDVAAGIPLVADLKVTPTGISVGSLRERADLERLDEAIEQTLVALLTLIGNLTNDILTPALHTELTKVSLGEATEEPR